MQSFGERIHGCTVPDGRGIEELLGIVEEFLVEGERGGLSVFDRLDAGAVKAQDLCCRTTQNDRRVRRNDVLLAAVLRSVEDDAHELQLVLRRQSRFRFVEQIQPLEPKAVTLEKSEERLPV